MEYLWYNGYNMKKHFNKWFDKNLNTDQTKTDNEREIAIRAWNAAIGHCLDNAQFHYVTGREFRNYKNDMRQLKYK